jgi:hypothetical protein
MTKIRSIYVVSAVSLLLGAAHLRADVPMVDFTSVTNNFSNGARAELPPAVRHRFARHDRDAAPAA